jgi:hypothetical protein
MAWSRVLSFWGLTGMDAIDERDLTTSGAGPRLARRGDRCRDQGHYPGVSSMRRHFSNAHGREPGHEARAAKAPEQGLNRTIRPQRPRRSIDPTRRSLSTSFLAYCGHDSSRGPWTGEHGRARHQVLSGTCEQRLKEIPFRAFCRTTDAGGDLLPEWQHLLPFGGAGVGLDEITGPAGQLPLVVPSHVSHLSGDDLRHVPDPTFLHIQGQHSYRPIVLPV